ncbi:MAG TPA: cytochrome b N-terminal domain-containing protein, partial [Vicinamibacteria bacterium]|nr:cytochrome b N-terminal domain-containing protein [Vicinamibacteria bacterium]
MSTTAKPIPAIPSAPNVHPKALWSLKPRSDRESGDAVVSNFLLHWFPAKVFKASLDWTYSFWLGTITSALFLLLILSGLPLLFLYVPSVERAYASVKDIEYVITFGSWIRSVHRLSAHLMVAAVFLHLVRVFLTGAYKNGTGRGQRRQWNWVIGVGMLLATLFLSFTGYLLPWDQLAYWAVTVGTNIASSIPYVGPAVRELMIGGRTIDQPTLIRFYVLHIVLLPGLLAALFVYHMWRVRKDGGLARADREALLRERVEEPPARTKTYTLLGVARGTAPTIRSTTLEAPHRTVNAVPDLVRRAATAVLGTIAVISILSTLVRSPLEEAANALVTP